MTAVARESLEIYIWDLYKEVNGIRPRHIDFAEMSVQELQDMAARLEYILVSA